MPQTSPVSIVSSFIRHFRFAALLTLCAAALAALTAIPSKAEQPALANPARITHVVDNSVLTTLTGNVHPLARPQFDRGEAAGGLPMKRILMVLKRGDIQQAALKTFLDQQQDKHSASYHQWLTPEQLGTNYGPAPEDIKTITTWLQGQGFSVGRVAKGRMFIEFSGTAAQVATAFHTSIHSYVVEGQQHYANASNPRIPTALTSVVAGLDSLNNFPRKTLSHVVGNFQREKKTGKFTPVAGSKPRVTFGSGNTASYGVGPSDLATIYNISPLWNASTPLDGTGQTIAIAGRTDINPQDTYDFRTIFGLPTGGSLAAFQQQYLNIIVDGPDPGNLGGNEEVEANVDVQWSGSVAKSALIDFVTSQSTTTTGGEDLSSLYIIDNNLAPVMSYSFGLCELGLGTGGNQFLNALWEQASAQGISAFVASGDEGSASCDAGSTTGAQFGYTVSGNAATPFNVAVGGTDFDQLDNNPANFWNATNDPTTQASAKGYIPETTWNDSCTNAIFLQVSGSSDPITNCNNSDVITKYGGLGIGGASGGPSTCIQSTNGDPSTCAGGYAKPSWQVGTFNDNVRDLPDISLFASNGFSGSFYVVCVSDLNTDGNPCSLSGDYIGVGGTSVSSPAVAGMFSILNQKLGARVGNPNYALYNLAANQSAASCNSTSGPGSSCIFNDVTKGTISQACVANSSACLSDTGDANGVIVFDDGSGYNKADSSGYPGDLAWNTGVGYDYATGLGSVNAYNLVNQWSTANFLASATTLALSSTTFAHGTDVTATVNVTSSSGTPSGDISFNGATGNGSVGAATLSAGSAIVTLNSLPGGSYNVVAHYGGNNDGTNLFAGSDSNPVAVTVSPEASTTTLTAYLYDPTSGSLTTVTTASYGSALIAKADVAGASGNGLATGTVAVTANGTALSGSPFKLNSVGSAEDQFFPIDAGAYTVVANYSGDPSFNTSTATGSLTISKATPAAAIQSSASSVAQGASVTLSAVFSTTTYVGVAPTGTVTFYNGTTAIGSPVNVVGGTDATTKFPNASGSLATAALAVGTNSITAKYSGDGNYAAVTSSPVTVTVTSGTVTGSFTIAGSAVSVSAGATSGNTSTVTVTPATGFTGVVNLVAALTTSPAGAVHPPTIALAAASVTITGTTAGTTTATISTTAPTTTSGAISYPKTNNWFEAAGGAALACVLFFGIPARRRGWKSMLGLLVFLVTMAGVGCGGGGSKTQTVPGTTAGSYVITVTGTDAATGKITATGTINLTVN